MKKKISFLLALTILLSSFAFIFTSCADDDEKTTDKKSGETTTDETTAFYGEETTKIVMDNISQGELVLVNKHYAYNPDNAKILQVVHEGKNSYYQAKDYSVKNTVNTIKALNRMFEAFVGQGGERYAQATSGFRTIAEQQAIADRSPEEVDVFIARAGYSEHHTGLAVDINVYKDGKTYNLVDLSEYAWIYDNAHKYGFILRYPVDKSDITGFQSESWHFRYVGVPHATYMYENDLCLEEYIDFIKGYSYDKPLTINTDEGVYIAYFVAKSASGETEVPVYKNTKYTISGNNVDGYIVTASPKK